MKIQKILVTLSILTSIITFNGCGKSDGTTSSSSDNTTPASPDGGQPTGGALGGTYEVKSRSCSSGAPVTDRASTEKAQITIRFEDNRFTITSKTAVRSGACEMTTSGIYTINAQQITLQIKLETASHECTRGGYSRNVNKTEVSDYSTRDRGRRVEIRSARFTDRGASCPQGDTLLTVLERLR